MSLIISATLAKREIGKSASARAEVVDAWRKRVFVSLPAKGIDGARLLKAYVTTASGARRTLFLLQGASGDVVFLMHRPKGDSVGANMSYANPSFKPALDEALRTALSDIESGAIETVES